MPCENSVVLCSLDSIVIVVAKSRSCPVLRLQRRVGWLTKRIVDVLSSYLSSQTRVAVVMTFFSHLMVAQAEHNIMWVSSQ